METDGKLFVLDAAATGVVFVGDAELLFTAGDDAEVALAGAFVGGGASSMGGGVEK